MTNSVRYQLIFRFRVGNSLSIAESEYRTTIEGRDVLLRGDQGGDTIKDCNWLSLTAKDFKSEEEAWTFGRRLRAAAEIASIGGFVGIDSGDDRSSGWIHESVVAAVTNKSGKVYRQYIHGLDVFSYPPEPFTVIVGRAEGGSSRNPKGFFESVDDLVCQVDNLSDSSRNAAKIFNSAIISSDSLACTLLAISAIECLGQRQEWSDSQKEILQFLARCAEDSDIGSPVERLVVRKEMESRLVGRLSLRQGVLQLLSDYHLEDLKSEWDEVYKQRSNIVHGGEKKAELEYWELSSRALSLCGRILLKVISSEVPSATKHIGQHYKAPSNK